MNSIVKPTLLTLAVALMSSVGIAQYAPQCEKIEYAELKDMSKDELIQKACLYAAFGDIADEGFHSFLNMNNFKDADEYRLAAAQCGDERMRILGILDRTYHLPKQPTKGECDAASAALQAKRKSDKEAADKH